MTDAHMPDQIRVPHSQPYWADEAEPEDEILPYTVQQLHEAGQRSVTWRVQCARLKGAKMTILNSIAFSSKPEDLTSPDREGWMRIGWVVDPSVGGNLRVFWHPSANRVQVDRPPQRDASRTAVVHEQAPSPMADGTLMYVAVIRVLDDDTVTLEVRPLYSGEPQARTRHMRVVVPADGTEYFEWAMAIAARKHNTVFLPGDFWERPSRDRRDILVAEGHALAKERSEKRRS